MASPDAETIAASLPALLMAYEQLVAAQDTLLGVYRTGTNRQRGAAASRAVSAARLTVNRLRYECGIDQEERDA